jgi:hypothetical protein
VSDRNPKNRRVENSAAGGYTASGPTTKMVRTASSLIERKSAPNAVMGLSNVMSSELPGRMNTFARGVPSI